MSKKSRRRNKRLLMLAALAGGAAFMGRRGKGVAQGVSGSDKAKFTSDAAYKTPTSQYITKKDPVDNVVADSASKKVFLGNTRLKRDGMGPMESVIAKRKIPGYGTAVAPPGILNPYKAPSVNPRRPGIYKKGGRVTGIAKRGFGRALMKGKK